MTIFLCTTLLFYLGLVFPDFIAAQSSMDTWLTTGDESSKLSPAGSIVAGPQDPDKVVVSVNPTQQDQSILGFGAALSNSAAYLIYNSPEKQTILNDLYGVGNGIGMEFVRLVMGGSDFNAVSPYSYDDMPPGEKDWDLVNFSIEKDRHFMIPLLKEILQVNPAVKILASPWSAPGWMKDTDSLYGGNMLEGAEYQDALARYFVTFVQAYQLEGLAIHAITLQNEPEHESAGYPTMSMASWLQRDIIRYHVGPQFQQQGITTQIWTWDHNWDGAWYVHDVLSEPEAAQYVSGSAWHCYSGDRNDPVEIREQYPDKSLFFTECSSGDWDTNFASSLIWSIENLFMGQTRIGSEVVLMWNLALDENHGPTFEANGCQDCRGVIQIPSSGGYFPEIEYYSTGHFSKFVRQGAIKIDSSMPGSGVQSVAFLNPDGSIVTVVINTSWDSAVSFQIALNGEYFVYDDLPSRSVLTFIKAAA